MNSPQFNAALHFISNRGRAPISFLTELVEWGKKALVVSPEIFAPNDNPNDAYAAIVPYLGMRVDTKEDGSPVWGWANRQRTGPDGKLIFDCLLSRVAAMLELIRVHAGIETSWQWLDGADTTNRRSLGNIKSAEAGILQVSFDSEFLSSVDGQAIMAAFGKSHGLDTPEKFIPAMKTDHALALEYYVRLVRVSIKWAGPLINSGDEPEDKVYPYLYRDSMLEFLAMLN